jgi:hypothetical protein
MMRKYKEAFLLSRKAFFMLFFNVIVSETLIIQITSAKTTTSDKRIPVPQSLSGRRSTTTFPSYPLNSLRRKISSKAEQSHEEISSLNPSNSLPTVSTCFSWNLTFSLFFLGSTSNIIITIIIMSDTHFHFVLPISQSMFMTVCLF